jgi:hypothetical protein
MKAYCFSHDLFFPNTTTLSELNMSQSTISQSPVHNGAYIVTHPDGRQVPCHNLSTAKVEAGLLNLTTTRVNEQITVEQYYGCVLGGMGHTPAITWTITGRVERCHNWATARTLMRDNEKLRSSLS